MPVALDPRYVCANGSILAVATFRPMKRTTPIWSVRIDGTSPPRLTGTESSTVVGRRLLSKKSRRTPSSTTGTYGLPPCNASGTLDEVESPSQNDGASVGSGRGVTAPTGAVVGEIACASGGGAGGGGSGVNVG